MGQPKVDCERNMRFLKVVEMLGVGDKELDGIGLGKDLRSKIKTNRQNLSIEKLTLFCERYESVNATFLITGRGLPLLDFNDGNKLPQYLYHYTQYENAMSILEQCKLFLGDLKNSNDIAERDYNGEYRYISFVGSDDEEDGATKPTMWHHYTDGNRGCCIAFNLQKLVSLNNIKDEDIFKINYRPKKWFRENHVNSGDSEILRNKLDDWKQEQEVRIISKEIRFLDINKCVECVYIGRDSESFLTEEVLREYISSGKCKFVNVWGAILSTRHGDKDVKAVWESNMKALRSGKQETTTDKTTSKKLPDNYFRHILKELINIDSCVAQAEAKKRELYAQIADKI